MVSLHLHMLQVQVLGQTLTTFLVPSRDVPADSCVSSHLRPAPLRPSPAPAPTAREITNFQLETQKRGQEQDLAKVTHETVKYPDDGAPGLAFFQLLAHHPDATWRGGGNPDSARLQAGAYTRPLFSST